jgi:hypothetical protein
MTGYLAVSGLQLAILINFKNAKLEWKRIARNTQETPSGIVNKQS